jgi:hypothetical protein
VLRLASTRDDREVNAGRRATARTTTSIRLLAPHVPRVDEQRRVVGDAGGCVQGARRRLGDLAGRNVGDHDRCAARPRSARSFSAIGSLTVRTASARLARRSSSCRTLSRDAWLRSRPRTYSYAGRRSSESASAATPRRGSVDRREVVEVVGVDQIGSEPPYDRQPRAVEARQRAVDLLLEMPQARLRSRGSSARGHRTGAPARRAQGTLLLRLADCPFPCTGRPTTSLYTGMARRGRVRTVQVRVSIRAWRRRRPEPLPRSPRSPPRPGRPPSAG